MVQWVVASRVVIQTVHVLLRLLIHLTLMVGISWIIGVNDGWSAIKVTIAAVEVVWRRVLLLALVLVLLLSATRVEGLSRDGWPKMLLANRVVHIWSLLLSLRGVREHCCWGQLLVLVGWLLRIVKEACLVGSGSRLGVRISTGERLFFSCGLVGGPFEFSLLLGVHTDSIRLVLSLRRLSKLVILAYLEIVLSESLWLRSLMRRKLTLESLML